MDYARSVPYNPLEQGQGNPGKLGYVQSSLRQLEPRTILVATTCVRKNSTCGSAV